MDKFWTFRELLDFVANHADVIDADMSNYCGDMVIIGDTGEQTVTLTISIKDKEEKEDD